jgi:hypothetical protein
MRIENNKIFIRQSWLGDALMCPERARLSALHPETRKENDSAMMGTAVHAGIEAVLKEELDPQYIGEHSVEAFRMREQELHALGKSINITNTDPKNWDKHINSMAEAWVRDIYPHVPRGGITEYKFETKVGAIANELFEYELWFEGTMDYFHPQGIWDWKTAARKYYEAEKQTQNIQSAIYAESAVTLGMMNYDVDFTFGVMIRNASSTGQILTVNRTASHGQWIINQTKSLVNTLLTMQKNLPQEKWLVNDQHYLCSQRWCPVWSMCKGSYITSDNNNAEEA